MTMAMQAVQIPTAGPKVLRIGVIQNGRIVEERIIGKRETVTVSRLRMIRSSTILPAWMIPIRRTFGPVGFACTACMAMVIAPGRLGRGG